MESLKSFVDEGVPRLLRAFDLDKFVEEEENAPLNDSHPPLHDDGGQRALSNAAMARNDDAALVYLRRIPAVVQGLLCHFFGENRATASGADTMSCRSGQTPSSFPWPPLTPREVRLLCLYRRKTEQLAYRNDAYQHLLAAAHGAAQQLCGAVAAAGEEAVECSSQLLANPTSSSLPCPTRLPPGKAAEALLSHAAATDGAGMAGVVFTSMLADIPIATAATATCGDPSPLSASPLLVVNTICAGCHEGGGDLLLCTQCGELRHEGCGGPHPLDRGTSSSMKRKCHPADPGLSRERRNEEADGAVGGHGSTMSQLCQSCRRALNLSTSDSSLNSSTSSSERLELEEYFGSGSDGGTDSSLSGFVVHTSEDDDEEEERSSCAPSDASTSSASSSASAPRRVRATKRKQASRGRRKSRLKARESVKSSLPQSGQRLRNGELPTSGGHERSRGSSEADGSSASSGRTAFSDDNPPLRRKDHHAAEEVSRVKKKKRDQAAKKKGKRKDSSSSSASSASSCPPSPLRSSRRKGDMNATASSGKQRQWQQAKNGSSKTQDEKVSSSAFRTRSQLKRQRGGTTVEASDLVEEEELQMLGLSSSRPQLSHRTTLSRKESQPSFSPGQRPGKTSRGGTRLSQRSFVDVASSSGSSSS